MHIYGKVLFHTDTPELWQAVQISERSLERRPLVNTVDILRSDGVCKVRHRCRSFAVYRCIAHDIQKLCDEIRVSY